MFSTKQNHLYLTVAFSLVLLLAIIITYKHVFSHEFINFDDNCYIYENKNVQTGFTLRGIYWSFTSIEANNWHPVTWLSHMLDCQLFGMNAFGHHLVSVLFHSINAWLLFYFLFSATKIFWPSAFVSMLFALHPLHVESVAWASERKDLLSTFFMLLTLLSYSAYKKKQSIWNYFAILFFFVLALMSKPMVVSLPFLLLLLESWPLVKKQQYTSASEHEKHPENAFHAAVSFLVCKKTPLFILSGASCIVTYYAQQQSGAIESLSILPIALRISNALSAYVGYLGKMVYPVDLAIFYPYPTTIPFRVYSGAAFIILAISISVLRLNKKYPFLAVGWFWYLISLLPVIGLVQVGAQSMADRYTYIPLIGIFIMISFSFAEWVKMNSSTTWIVAFFVLFVLAVLSSRQVVFWKNSEALFRHALAVTENNYLAHNYLAKAMSFNGNFSEAEQHYAAALTIKPGYLEPMVNVGVILAEQGRTEQAYAYLKKAAQIDPLDPKIQNNLGNIHNTRDQFDKAVVCYQNAIAVDPNYKEALFNLAKTREKQSLFSEAEILYYKLIKNYPLFAEAFNGLGLALSKNGKSEESIKYFRKALDLKPGYREAKKNLELATSKVKHLP